MLPSPYTMYSPASEHAWTNVYLAGATRAQGQLHTASFGAALQITKTYSLSPDCLPVTRVSTVAEAPQDILIARPEARRTMGLPDLVLPINLALLVGIASSLFSPALGNAADRLVRVDLQT